MKLYVTFLVILSNSYLSAMHSAAESSSSESHSQSETQLTDSGKASVAQWIIEKRLSRGGRPSSSTALKMQCWLHDLPNDGDGQAAVLHRTSSVKNNKKDLPSPGRVQSESLSSSPSVNSGRPRSNTSTN